MLSYPHSGSHTHSPCVACCGVDTGAGGAHDTPALIFPTSPSSWPSQKQKVCTAIKRGHLGYPDMPRRASLALVANCNCLCYIITKALFSPWVCGAPLAQPLTGGEVQGGRLAAGHVLGVDVGGIHQAPDAGHVPIAAGLKQLAEGAVPHRRRLQRRERVGAVGGRRAGGRRGRGGGRRWRGGAGAGAAGPGARRGRRRGRRRRRPSALADAVRREGPLRQGQGQSQGRRVPASHAAAAGGLALRAAQTRPLLAVVVRSGGSSSGGSKAGAPGRRRGRRRLMMVVVGGGGGRRRGKKRRVGVGGLL